MGKVIGTDTDPSAIYDFLLVIYMGLSRTVCEIKSDNCNILPPRVFNAPAEGFPLEVCNGAAGGSISIE